MRRRQRGKFRLLFERLEDRRLLASDFTIGVLPDTQFYAESYPEIFNSQTQWLADNVMTEGIAFVSHVGDVVDNPNLAIEWERAEEAMSALDGDLAANPDGVVPYSITLGNHDYDVVDDHSSAVQFLNRFGPSQYSGRSWYGGASPDQLNQYQIFDAGEYRFLHLSLEWEARDSSIAWAQTVLDANPGLPTILTTHAYLHDDGGRFSGATTADGNDGEEVFQQLIASNPQIFLVMGGHFTGERHEVSLNNAGTEVIEILADYQGRENGGNGWMQLLDFHPDLDRIDVTTYSPWLDSFETDDDSQFSLNIDFSQRFEIDSIPSIQLSQPVDNGLYDLDPAVGSVALGTALAAIDLRVTDLAPGIDDASVSASTVTLAKDGVPLEESLDYHFSYDLDSGRIQLSPTDVFFGDGQYEISVNSGQAKIADLDGNKVVATNFHLDVDTSRGNSAESFYLSLRGSGVVNTGFSYSSNDILYFDGANASHLLDGSDVGLDNLVIDGFAIIDDQTVLISFTSSASLPGISQTVDDSDIVKFRATQFGEDTAGSFEIYFDGSDVGLTLSGEDIDAIAVLPNGNLLVSTYGAYSVADISGADEDLLEFAGTSFGSETAGSWSLYFDGSDAGLANEDTNAVTVAGNGDIYLSNSSYISWPGFSAADDDVFVFVPTSLGANTSGDLIAPQYFDGTDLGLGPDDIYGIHIPKLGPVTVNDPPLAVDDFVFTNEDTSLTINALADNGGGADSDSDGALVPASVTIVNHPAAGSLGNNGDGTLRYTPSPDFFGSDAFTYTVRDDQGAISNVATVSINVAAINDAPVARDDLIQVDEGDSVTIAVLADNGFGSDVDVEGGLAPSSVTVTAGVAYGTLDNRGDGTFLYTPSAGFAGMDSFTYFVLDEQGAASNDATVTILVSEQNDAPIAFDDVFSVAEDASLTLDVLADNGYGADSDADGAIQPSSVAQVSLPVNGSLVNNGDGTFLYTPSSDFYGNDSFTYTLQDNDGARSNIATVAISVIGVNDAPLARDDRATTSKDTSLVIAVLLDNGSGVDEDIDGVLLAATVTATALPANGSLQNNGDGTFTYTPNEGFVGTDSFVYTVTDDGGATSNAAAVSISVVDASAPIVYFALNSTFTLDGELTVANEDIVAFDGTVFSLLFDGSDVGLSGKALSGFAIVNDTELLLAFNSTVTLPGIAETVTEQDIVKFSATQLGNDTAGSFELYFDGSDVGLVGDYAELDGIDLLDDGRLVVSTTGSTSVPGASVRDEDLLAFTPTSTGTNTAGDWAVYLDSGDVGLGGEDVDALAVGTDGMIYLSVQNAFALSEFDGDDEDIMSFLPNTIGDATTGAFDSVLHFDGSSYGLVDMDVRAIDIDDGISALRADVVSAEVADGVSSPLGVAEAEAMLKAAVGQWQSAEAADAPRISVEVSDLPGDWLAMTQGNTITFDTDAAGLGWFVDSTPGDPSEFSLAVGLATLEAQPGSAAAGLYDLLTAAAHEVGHLLGFPHSDDGGLMTESLSPGVRRLPVSSQATRAATTSDLQLGTTDQAAQSGLRNSNDAARQKGRVAWQTLRTPVQRIRQTTADESIQRDPRRLRPGHVSRGARITLDAHAEVFADADELLEELFRPF